MPKNEIVLRRFLKGFIAVLATQTILYVTNALPELNLVPATLLPVITGLLLAIEKAIPNNF